jgi:hypothetical protein
VTRVPFTHTWIEPGKILAGSIPQLAEDLDILKSLGIQGLISLTRRDIWTYPNMGKWWGDRHNIAQWPIPDGGIDEKMILNAAGCLAYEPAYPAYIHCRGGIGRTGTVLLTYYVLHRGLSLAQAKELVKVRRNYEGNASAIDQGSPQREWIDGLEARRNAP